MRFQKNNHNPTYSNPLTLLRENSRYEIIDLENDTVSFRLRLPRSDSKYWKFEYMVWDLERNCPACSVRARDIHLSNFLTDNKV